MELPHMGKQCSTSNCKQLDFLPFECKSCKLIFCREHFHQHSEYCQNKNNKQSEIETKETVRYACAKPGCTEVNLVPLLCDRCQRHFCVTHRHVTGCEEVDENELRQQIEQLNAPKLRFEEVKAAVDKQIDLNIAKSKHKETANKIQLMRLKAKATGSKTIPTANRLYFNIFNSKFCPNGHPIFVSNDWTIGRCIDSIADECKIPNNNNKSTSAKLRLFRKSDNQVLSELMSVNIQSLITNSSIVNGDSLVIDYV